MVAVAAVAVLPLAAPAAGAAPVRSATGAPTVRSAPAKALQLSVPARATPGRAVDVVVAVANGASVAGFAANLRFDGQAVDVERVVEPAALPGGRGGALQPLSVVETPNRTVLAGWSCSGPACRRLGSTTPSAAPRSVRLATIELTPRVAGLIQLRLDGATLVDAAGRTVVRQTAPVDVLLHVGSGRRRYPAPSGAASAAGPPGGPADANRDGRVTTADVDTLLPAWIRAAESDRPCPPSPATGGTTAPACASIDDIQHVAAAIDSADATAPVPSRVGALRAPTPTFTVNSTGDGADAAIDGVCQTVNAGECTLRAALQEANHASSAATIAFNIPGTGLHTIAPATGLPALTNPNGTTIDGFTQPGSSPNTDPLIDNAVRTIELVGHGPQGIDGFFVTSSSNTIRGLDMHAFDRSVWIYGPNANSNTIVGDLLGLTPSGGYDPTQALYGPSSCVVIQGSPTGASNNHIGAPGAANRNTISGCNHQGVALYNIGTNGNVIQNDIIGLDPTGTQRRGNLSHGVDINTGTQATLVGGTGPQQGNVLSGNFQEGAEISHNPYTLYNQIVGNRIGTDPTGNAAPAYAQDGQWGVHLEGYPNCGTTACPLDAGNSTVSDNIIVGAGHGGIMVDKGVHDSVIARNRIGVTANGTPAGNALFGININAGSVRTLIDSNEIAYNEAGIQIESDGVEPPDSASMLTDQNQITRNSIHDNASGGIAALGIDLAPFGTVNTAGNADPNVNDGMLAPTVIAKQPAYIDYSTCAGCTVEGFVADRAAGLYGSGKTYLGRATADGSGTARLFLPPSAQGAVVTATATNTNGGSSQPNSTSEFASNTAVPTARPNDVAPTAAFSVSCSHVTCTFNATTSSDPDGSVVRYQWDFGDNSGNLEGTPITHTYGGAHGYTVTLTVTDNDGATSTITHIANPTDTPPVAAFAVTCSFQVCNVDASASADADGDPLAYSWDFGDGTGGPGNAVTTSHTFAASGTYTITLIVSDQIAGGTTTATHQVTVQALPPGTFAFDAFGRTASNGWASADLGGAWTVNGPNADWSVGGGAGKVAITAASSSHLAYVSSLAVRDSDTVVDVATDKTPTGGTWGQVADLTARRIAANFEYRVRLRFPVGGGVKLSFVKVLGSTSEVAIGNEVTVPGLAYAPGQKVSLRFRVTGVNPTMLQARAWLAGTSEPSTWLLGATDAQPELQSNGFVGVRANLGANATNTPVAWAFDNFDAVVINTPPVASFTSQCAKNVCSFDASASSDADGSIASYAWSFGDGTNGSGVTPPRTYAAQGTYDVTLTVTDNLGATSTVAHLVAAVDQPPVASFSATCSKSTCSFDASSSADPDGSVVAYAWDFGDGASATGVTASHTWTAPDVYTVVLQVTDDGNLTSATSQSISIPVPNQPPVAAFRASCNQLSCTLDASTSSDPDGTVVAWTWSFSDGATATGVAPSHTFPAAGTWPVTLTVTDDSNATGSLTQNVTVAPASTPPLYASDTYTRSVTGGWGSADTGGAWTNTNATFAVNGAVGTQKVNAVNGGNNAYLPSFGATDVDVQVKVAADAAAAGTGHWATISVRRVTTNFEYRVRVRMAPAGVGLAVLKLTGSASSTLVGSEVASGLAYTPGQLYRVRAQAFGTSPTTVRAKVWLDGTTEPASWLVSRTDSSNGIQAAGQQGLGSFDAATPAPVTFTFDNLVVAPTDVPPVASFATSCTWLSCNVDATASSDPDGSIASYQWSFGDGATATGATATGATASHTYASGGFDTITLTVTDNLAAQTIAAHTVSVAANVPPTPQAAVSCNQLACSFDASASSDPDDAIASYAWDFSDGTGATGVTAAHTFAVAGTWPVRLTVTDAGGAATTITTNVAVAPNPAPTVYASDGFGRTVAGGWGSADTGGAWTLSGAASNFAVSGGAGTFTHAAAATSNAARLLGVTSTDVDVQTRVSFDHAQSGSGSWINVIARDVAPNNEYRARVRFGGASVLVGAFKLTGSSGATAIGSELAVPGLSSAAHTWYRVRMNVTGTNPTTLRVKVWLDGSPEPATWALTVTDSAPALQAPGATGLQSYAQSSSAYPLTFSFDDYTVRPANQPPTAAFTPSCNGLACNVDASASTDDGSVASYQWSFGDGTTATGVTASHAYAAAGTYTVTVTVTDNQGVASVASQQVTVS